MSKRFSAESVMIAFKLLKSLFKESVNDADVLGNNAVISVENIIPPKIKTAAIMPNLIIISLQS